jgi:hypothetical protein
VFEATTWLNLMTIGDCADAGPATAKAATDAAAKISLRMCPPLEFLQSPQVARLRCLIHRHQYREAGRNAIAR